MVEELAGGVVRIEELHLQRRGIASGTGMAREDLVDPGHHGKRGGFDLPSRRARCTGGGTRLVEKAAGLLLCSIMGKRGAAACTRCRNGCIKGEAERDEGRKTVEQAGHEPCPAHCACVV